MMVADDDDDDDDDGHGHGETLSYSWLAVWRSGERASLTILGSWVRSPHCAQGNLSSKLISIASDLDGGVVQENGCSITLITFTGKS